MFHIDKDIFRPRRQLQFEDLIGNEEVVTRLLALLKNPYQPLIVLSGPKGSGITHLLNACGNLAEGEGNAVAYLTAEWMFELKKQIRTVEDKVEFIKWWKGHDLVCIDNLQCYYRKSKEHSAFLFEMIDILIRNKKKVVLGNSDPLKDISRSGSYPWPKDLKRLELQPAPGFAVFKMLKRLVTPEDMIPEKLLFVISGYNGNAQQYINCLVSVRFKSRMLKLDLFKMSEEEMEQTFAIRSYFPEQQFRRGFVQQSMHFIEEYRKLLQKSKS